MTIRMKLEFVDDTGREVFCLKAIDQIDDEAPVGDMYFGRGTIPVLDGKEIVDRRPIPPFAIPAETEREAFERFDDALKAAQDEVKKRFFEKMNKITLADSTMIPPINGKKRN